MSKDTATSGYVQVGEVDLDDHGKHTVTTTQGGITWIPINPPATEHPRPPEIAPIPIPSPPPRKRSWLNWLIAFIRERTKS